ncbi:hypothetical protein OGAPHI_002293 [Ogataea philodendri]|uniref:CCHC-type domain-containing protein n=1 Tax=Ogataea philodendri TaxID=1378263 RepID=A0A9P8T7J9_9ASCO|nr:uncharacterized protein OGAPHI_002293 [Ogataea philodendri]KAH3668539.1 hypothetical protein OGAPHI_002293 [Ogataea philodendri]
MSTANSSLTSLLDALEQVMSPVSVFWASRRLVEDQKLKSAENFPEWRGNLRLLLEEARLSLLEYADTGNVSVPGEDYPEAARLVLRNAYEEVIQMFLENTVSDAVWKVIPPDIRGRSLLHYLEDKFGQIKISDLYRSLESYVRNPNMDVYEWFNLTSNIGGWIDDRYAIMTLYHLALLQDEKLEQEFFKSEPVKVTRQMMINVCRYRESADNGGKIAFIAKKGSSSTPSKKKKKKNICLRCKKPGHKSPDCTAPFPVGIDESDNRGF